MRDLIEQRITPIGNKDLPKGQTHQLEIHESDIVIIKCGHAEARIYPYEMIVKQDGYGRYYYELKMKNVDNF